MSLCVAKEINWEAAHRLVYNYPGKCRHVHGHSYKAVFELALSPSASLDKFGFVRDFSDFKKVKRWVMDHWDHASLVCCDDKTWITWLRKNRQRYFLFGSNPTAENIAKQLMVIASAALDTSRCYVRTVTVYETVTSKAVVSRPFAS